MCLTRVVHQHRATVCHSLQVLACLVAAIIAGMTLQSGSAIHQQVKRSVYMDSAEPESTADAADNAGAARKLHGMLSAGLVSGCFCSWLRKTHCIVVMSKQHLNRADAHQTREMPSPQCVLG
jgi:hypothetical protein